MESTRRTRTRTPGQRPTPHLSPPRPHDDPHAPDLAGRGNHRCSDCQAWVEATFKHGMLFDVRVQHRWMPCLGRHDQLPISDWVGAYVNPTGSGQGLG